MINDVVKLCSVLDEIIDVGSEVKHLGVNLSYTIAWGSRASMKAQVVDEVVKQLMVTIPSKLNLEGLKFNAVVRAYRDFYWRIGIDPTKVRPSSEALVRRVLRGNFPRIDPVVDAGNVASVETLVPIGIYDLRKVKLPLNLTLSVGGEVFLPIGGDSEVLPAGIPVLKDSAGRVVHLYPHRDCKETMVTNETEEVVIVSAGVPNVDLNLIKKATERTAEILSLMGWGWCGRVVIK